MKKYLTGWYVMRIVRLALGLLVIWQAIQIKEWAAGLIGVLLVLLAVTNTACCGANACPTPRVNKKN